MSERRMGRIEEEIRKIIGDIFLNNVKNPQITGMISVTGVSISNDLKYANVYVSIFDKDNKIESNLKAINKTKGFIRKELASKINLRCIPELEFKLDNSIQYGAHIDDILNEILPNNDN